MYVAMIGVGQFGVSFVEHDLVDEEGGGKEIPVNS